MSDHWKEPDFDNDRRYRTPRAWRNVKAAFGPQNRMNRLFLRLEKLARSDGEIYCPRFALALAMEHFLGLSPAARAAVLQAHYRRDSRIDGRGYHHNHEEPARPAPPSESLPAGEASALAGDLADVLRKLAEPETGVA